MSDSKETSQQSTEEEIKKAKERAERFDYNYSEFKRKKTFEQPCVRTTFLTSKNIFLILTVTIFST